LGTKLQKQKFQKIKDQNLKKKSGNKIWEQKFQKSGNENNKIPGTKITKSRNKLQKFEKQNYKKLDRGNN
jgi:hypothetical protein